MYESSQFAAILAPTNKFPRALAYAGELKKQEIVRTVDLIVHTIIAGIEITW